MNTSTRLFLLLFFSSVFINTNLATIVVSNGTGGGAWGAGGTWNPGVPACGDTITIQAGDVVTIEVQQDYSGCAVPMFIIIDGTLEFPVNGPKLRLPCDAGVIINAGGSLIATASGGGGSANFLEICGSVVWKKADGPQFGPLVFGTPLPIQLLSFEATVNVDQIELMWITETEINNDYFVVERSIDGFHWENVLVTSGAGNSNTTVSYFEIDYDPLEGISYYRLKQVDFNGEFTVSNIVPVKFDSKITDGNINLFPSPLSAGENLNIALNDIKGNEVLVILRDAKGKTFYSKVIIQYEDHQLIGLPLQSNLSSGIYLITATSEDQTYSQKILIK